MFRKKIKILVHSGRFHADDVFAVAALKRYFNNQKVVVIRNRDVNSVQGVDIIVDVGQIYNHEQRKYDHHQAGGAGVRESGVPYASFGLIWKHYGESICNSLKVANVVDKKLVSPVDATDVGYGIGDFQQYDLDLMVHSFHPIKGSNEDWDKMFDRAVDIASVILDREIGKAKVKVKDMKRVLEVYENAEDKRILIFDEPTSLGDVLDNIPEPIYSISPDSDGKSWKIYAIPEKDGNAYVHRKSFPEAWGGLEFGELEKQTKIEGSVFCHSGRFLCVMKTREGAVKLARRALEL